MLCAGGQVDHNPSEHTRQTEDRMRLSHLLEALPTVLAPVSGDVEIHGIAADSRCVDPGDLFVAIPGVHLDGHCFIAEALSEGAVTVVGERGRSALQELPRSTIYVQVPNTREAWGWLCAAWHDFPSRKITLIGVTGTDGKTTTVSLIHAILRAAGIRAGMVNTVKALIPPSKSGDGEETAVETGLHTTTPDPPEIQRYLAQMDKGGATHAVLEVTSHGLAQHRVAGCDFDAAVVTNITHEHLDYHGSREAYRRAKARLFEGLQDSFRKSGVPKIAVVNGDDDSCGYLSGFAADQRLVYSAENPADVTAERIHLDADRTRFELHTPRGTVDTASKLVGAYNVSNILAAASVGVGLGVSLEAIRDGVAGVSGVPGRMERIDEGQSFLAIVDFAHTPNALEQALCAARGAAAPDGRVIVVFGAAGLRDREKRRLMGEIGGRMADVVVLTAEDPRTESLDEIMAESAGAAEAQGKRRGSDLLLVRDRGEALLRACERARAGDVVIACGKGHEQSMCFGTTEYPWDDRRAMRLALRGEALDTLPTAGSGDEP